MGQIKIAKDLKHAFKLGRPELMADLLRQRLSVLVLRLAQGEDAFQAVEKFQSELGMDEYPVFAPRARKGWFSRLAIAGLLAVAGVGCAGVQVQCYVPIAETTSNDKRELDAAACSASTITVSQNMACMRLRGYHVRTCNADGSLAEQWVSIR